MWNWIGCRGCVDFCKDVEARNVFYFPLNTNYYPLDSVNPQNI